MVGIQNFQIRKRIWKAMMAPLFDLVTREL